MLSPYWHIPHGELDLLAHSIPRSWGAGTIGRPLVSQMEESCEGLSADKMRAVDHSRSNVETVGHHKVFATGHVERCLPFATLLDPDKMVVVANLVKM